MGGSAFRPWPSPPPPWSNNIIPLTRESVFFSTLPHNARGVRCSSVGKIGIIFAPPVFVSDKNIHGPHYILNNNQNERQNAIAALPATTASHRCRQPPLQRRRGALSDHDLFPPPLSPPPWSNNIIPLTRQSVFISTLPHNARGVWCSGVGKIGIIFAPPVFVSDKNTHGPRYILNNNQNVRQNAIAAPPAATASHRCRQPPLQRRRKLRCYCWVRLLKAKECSSLNFLTSVVWHPSNKQTNHGATKPDHGCFVWDNRMQRSRELGAPLTFPWRESAKLLGGRAAAAYVGCCVFCVVVASGLLANNIYQWYLLCRKLDIKSGKMADLCTLIIIEALNNTQNIKWLQNRNRS